VKAGIEVRRNSASDIDVVRVPDVTFGCLRPMLAKNSALEDGCAGGAAAAADVSTSETGLVSGVIEEEEDDDDDDDEEVVDTTGIVVVDVT